METALSNEYHPRMVKPRNLSPERARGRAGLLTVATLGAAGAALLSLFAVTEATVAGDGTLTEPFWALALGTLSLTAACLVGLGLLILRVWRRGR